MRMGEPGLLFCSGSKMTEEKGNKKEINRWMTLICTVIASLGVFCNGMFVGWTSHVSSMFSDEFSPRQKAWIGSGLALGAAISPLAVQKLCKHIGIKLFIILSCLLMTFSSMLLTLSLYYWWLLAARFIAGMAVGTIHLLVPVYINDIATNEQKPTFECLLQTQFVLGVLTMYIAGIFNSFIVSSIVSASVPILFLIGFCFMPESPRYLCLKGNTDAAKEVIATFKDIDEHVEQNIKLWSHQIKIQNNGFSLLYNGTFGARTLITIFGLVIFEQLIGAISIMFYMQKVLTFTRTDYSPETTGILCCAIFACSVFSPNLFGYEWKTKSILFWSTVCMSISLCVLGIHCHYQATFGHYEEYSQLPLYFIGMFYFCFAIGPYRLTWNLVEKLVQPEHYFIVRSLLVSASWLVICGITRILPRLIDVIGVGWLFWYMAIMCIFTAIFTSVFVTDFKVLSEERELFGSSESTNDGDV